MYFAFQYKDPGFVPLASINAVTESPLRSGRTEHGLTSHGNAHQVSSRNETHEFRSITFNEVERPAEMPQDLMKNVLPLVEEHICEANASVDKSGGQNDSQGNGKVVFQEEESKEGDEVVLEAEDPAKAAQEKAVTTIPHADEPTAKASDDAVVEVQIVKKDNGSPVRDAESRHEEEKHNGLVEVPETRREANDFYEEIRFCLLCHNEQPIRAKHCKVCGRCVAMYDHHCPWLGEKNHALFVIYLTFQFTQIIWLIEKFVVFIVGSKESWKSLQTWRQVINSIIIFMAGMYSLAAGMLLFYHLYLASRNLTTCTLSFNTSS